MDYRLDKTHPLANNLIIAMTFDDDVKNAVEGEIPVFTGPKSIIIDDNQRVLDLTAATNYLRFVHLGGMLWNREFTIAMKVRIPDAFTGPTQFAGICSLGQGSGINGWMLRCYGSPAEFQLYYKGGGSGSLWGGGTYPVTPGEVYWVHLRNYFNAGTLTMELRIDGLISETATGHSLGGLDGDEFMYVGTNGGVSSRYWGGMIYEFWMWDRSLSLAEINRHMISKAYRDTIIGKKPRFALTDMPADVRLLTAPKLKPWTKQPPAGTPIDKLHPMAKHLKFFTCFNDSGLEAIDLVTGARGVDQSTGASTAVKAINNFGKHLDVEAGSITTESTGLAWPIQPEYDLGGGKALTMLAHSHWENESDGNGTRMFSTQAGSTGYEMVYRPLSSEVRVHVDGTSAVISGVSSGTQNDDAHFAGTYNGSNVKAWFKTDLTFQTATAAKSNSMATVTADLYVGGREGLNRGFDGKVYWVALFDRVFNENEIRDFWANPWQIFEPQPIHATYPYVPAELGGPDGRDRLYTFKRFQ